MNLFTLFGRIAIDDKGATSKIDNVTNTARRSERSIGGSFKNIGKYIIAAFSVKALINFEKKIISTYATYDDQMRKVQAVSGATGEEYDKLRGKARELGKGTRYSATEAGGAMEALARSGWSVGEIMEGTGNVLMFASANALELDDAARITSGGLNKFGLDVSDAEGYMDVMSATAASSAADVLGLDESFRAATPTIKTLNYGVEDMSLAFGVLADNEIKGAAAGTQLNSAFMRMASGGKEVDTAIASLNDQTGINVNLFDEATGEARPFNDVLGDLRGAFSQLTDEQKAHYATQLFGQAGAKAMLPLLEATEENYDKVADAIGNADGTTKEMQKTMDGGLGGALARVKSAWEEFLLAMGEMQEGIVIDALGLIEQALLKLPDILEKVGSGWQKLKEFVKENETAFKAIGIALGILGVTFGVIMPVIELLAGVFVLLNSPIVAVVAIIGVLAGLAYAIKENWGPVSEFFSNLWEGVKELFSTAIEYIGELISTVWTAIADFFVAAWQVVTWPFKMTWEIIKSVVMSGLAIIEAVIGTVLGVIKSIWMAIWGSIKDYVMPVWEGIKKVVTTSINAVKNVITTVMNAIKAVITRIWNAIKTVTSTVWNGIKSVVTSIVNSIKSVITSIFNAIKSVVTSIWNAIKTAITVPLNAAKSTVTSIVNSIKSTVTRVFNSIKSTTARIWNSVKTSMTKPVDSAKNKIKSALDAIKGFFSRLKLKFPKIDMPELPHFKLDGKFSLKPPETPKLRVDWYADGGILTKPTVFGASGNTLMGGGEAGAEAVLPIEKLSDILANTLRGLGFNNENEDSAVNLEGIRTVIYEAILEAIVDSGVGSITLDGRELTRTLSPHLAMATKGRR